jgi:SET domain
MCVRFDASVDDGSAGRLVNDDHRHPNAAMRKTIINNEPLLHLFATRNINVGDEIRYNYGNGSYEWRVKVI